MWGQKLEVWSTYIYRRSRHSPLHVGKGKYVATLVYSEFSVKFYMESLDFILKSFRQFKHLRISQQMHNSWDTTVSSGYVTVY